MTDDKPKTEMVLRFVPPDDAHEVPAALLAKALEGFQGFAHVLAFQKEGRSLGKRFRVPADIAERYTLSCSPPVEGSFAISTRIAPSQPDLIAEQDVADFQHDLTESLAAIHRGDQATLSRILPDSRSRTKALSFLRSAVPPAGSGYRFGVMNGTGIEIPLRLEELKKIESPKAPEVPSLQHETVTGKLISISFEDRKVTILYAPTSRSLECVYSDDLELMLFENRRDLIQVTGQVLRGADGEPEKIIEVEAIVELDLSPMLLDEIPLLDGRVVKIKERISLTPVLSDSQQLLSLEHEPIQIDVFASTRDQLWEELLEQVAMLWVEYAESSEEDLSPPAREFREKLLTKAEVVTNAS